MNTCEGEACGFSIVRQSVSDSWIFIASRTANWKRSAKSATHSNGADTVERAGDAGALDWWHRAHSVLQSMKDRGCISRRRMRESLTFCARRRKAAPDERRGSVALHNTLRHILIVLPSDKTE